MLAAQLDASVARSLAAKIAEQQRATGVTIPITAVEARWAGEQREALNQSRIAINDLQQQLRASVEDDEELAALVLARDLARHAHINLIASVLGEHESRYISERLTVLSDEARALQTELSTLPEQHLVGASLTKRIRLTRLCHEGLADADAPLLSDLSAWEREIAHLRSELEDLRPHGGGVPPSLDVLHERTAAWEDSADAFTLAQSAIKLRRPPPDAAAKVLEARREVQLSERALRKERIRLARLASAHFPELFVREPQLRLGADADGTALQNLLVQRELDHYSGPDGAADLLNLPSIRHAVYRAEIESDDGGVQPCVLKEYKLGSATALKDLKKEVRLLSELQHPHIVELQAVFEQPGTTFAYLQLRFYACGDCVQWLEAASPDMARRKTVLQQLAQALHHLHSHGVAHGDVKLENVLISEDETAHLADFELSRDESPSATMTRLGRTTTATGGFSPQYAAPEMLCGEVTKPTAAADMYAYGVCALVACCGLDACVFSKSVGGELQQWSRDAAAAADLHLAPMLESLLTPAASEEEALRLRLSATRVLLHPFLDTAAERAAAAEASREAQQQVQEADSAQAAMRQRLEEEARHAHHRLETETAEARRRLVAEEEEARASIEALHRSLQACKAELNHEERQLRKQKNEVEAREKEVKHAAGKVHAEKQEVSAKSKELGEQKQRAQAAMDAAKAAAERKRRELEAKEADLKKEEGKLQAIRVKMREPPPYWDHSAARKGSDQFSLVPLSRARNGSVWRALEAFLKTDASELGKGADTSLYGRYDHLKLACAWRLQHRGLWDRYLGGQQQIAADMKQLRQQGKSHGVPDGLPAATHRLAMGLLGAEGHGAQLSASVNETMLMHASHKAVLLNILSTGANERFSGTGAGTAYGDGIYLAEDATKNDQYPQVDAAYDSGSELHQRLYGHGVKHPGKVFYLIVLRVALGHPARTKHSKHSAVDVSTGQKVFPICYRELATVPGVSPPVNFHSLLGLAYPRFREFIVFHGEYVYPEYILAYQRFNGTSGPV